MAARCAYVANDLSNNISSYAVAINGGLTLLNGTAAIGAAPNDLAVAVEGATSFLYALNSPREPSARSGSTQMVR